MIQKLKYRPLKIKMPFKAYLIEYPNGERAIRHYRSPEQALAHSEMLFFKHMRNTEFQLLGSDIKQVQVTPLVQPHGDYKYTKGATTYVRHDNPREDQFKQIEMSKEMPKIPCPCCGETNIPCACDDITEL